MELSEFEKAVMNKLLEGEQPSLEVLRQQLQRARVRNREHSGTGFFVEFDVDPNAPTLERKHRFHFGDVRANVERLASGAGFVLFIDEGRLEMLEGYSFGEPWTQPVTRFSLAFESPDRLLTQLTE